MLDGPFEFTKVERDGRLLIVTLNRPELLNAAHPPANYELARIFDDFAADPDLWVAIITGAGDRAFSAGADLKYAAAGGKVDVPPSGYFGLTARFDLHKPLIAAVNGLAMGGGFELALACDLIVATETAFFALSEPLVGRAALGGGLVRLPRVIPLKQAMGMILTGRRVSAAEGLRLGFVNEVAKPGDALAAARRWAAEMLACSPLALRTAKEVAYAGLDRGAADAYRHQDRLASVRAIMVSEDRAEGARAFAEKRPPRWTGR